MDSNSEISEKAVRIITIVTALTISAGFFIINLYLSEFGISDYGLLNAKAIFTGIVFVLILGIILITLLYGTNINDDKLTGFDFFVIFLGKPLLLSTLFFLFLIFDKLTVENLPRILIFEYFRIELSWVVRLGFTFYFIYLPYYFLNLLMFSPVNKKLDYILYGSLVFTIILFYCYPSFKKIILFFCGSNFIYLVSLTLHSNNYSIIKKLLKGDYYNLANRTFAGCMAVLLFFIMAGLYSYNVYPFVKEKYGGGLQDIVDIEHKNGKTSQGHLLHKDDKRLFILNDEKSVFIVDISEIKTLKIQR